MSLDFPEYATAYTQNARELRKALSADQLTALIDIDTDLSNDPDTYAHRTVPLGDDLFIYRYPSPAIELTCKIDRDLKRLYVMHIVAPALPAIKPLFISYAHTDAKWLAELRKWLKPLEKKELVNIWDDRDIKPGQDWLKEIRTSLDSARAAILLVSQDFLASDFIGNEELPKLLDAAEKKGVTIFWIAVSTSTVEDTDIYRFQAANDPSKPLDSLTAPKRAQEFQKIYKKLKDVVEG